MKVNRRHKSSRNQDISSTTEATPKTARMVNTRASENLASEEDVFAQLVNDEVARTQDTTTQASFKALIEKQVAIRTRADGSVNWEKVAKGALKWASSTKQNLIAKEDAEKIYSRTFNAAQIDTDTESLDDTSNSKAVLSRDVAFEKARVKLEKMISGESETPIRNLTEKVTASLLSGTNSSTSSSESSSSSIEDIILSNINFQI